MVQCQNSAFPCKGAGSIPGWGTKIPDALQPSHQNENRSNIVTDSIKTLQMVWVQKKKKMSQVIVELAKGAKRYDYNFAFVAWWGLDFWLFSLLDFTGNNSSILGSSSRALLLTGRSWEEQ